MLGIPDGTASLEEHSAEWDNEADITINKLRVILGGSIADIQHVGSTSVKGLRAKPIIDIVVGVESLDCVKKRLKDLEQEGFLYRPRTTTKSHLLLACRDLQKKMDTHYIHVVIYGGGEWNGYIGFRDALNESAGLRREYEALKTELARSYANDRMAYTQNKAEFIKNVLNIRTIQTTGDAL